MDLSTIEQKLKMDEYGSANDFWSDFQLMVRNAMTFNGPQHPVSVHGQNLEAYFARLMQLMPKRDIASEEKKKPITVPTRPMLPRRESRLVKSPQAGPSLHTPKDREEPRPQIDPNGVPTIRRDSTSDRPKRDIVKPVRDLPYSTPKPKKKKSQLELRFCEYIGKEIRKKQHQKYAWPFMAPVDPVALNIPSYHRIIKKPMDFGTMADNLEKGVYNSAKEYYNDAKLVFANCYKFNPPDDEVHRMGREFEAVFDDLWNTKDQWMHDNAPPPSEPASEDELVETPESEESDEEANRQDVIARMTEIQKQIAVLSAEAVRLSKASAVQAPSRSKKKSKATGALAPAHKKLGSTGCGHSKAGPSKPAPAKKTPKAKKLTLEQKKYVSDGIAMLDEAEMSKATQIIRNGIPSLRGRNDDELEIDVDDIPDAVLWELHKFVKNHRKEIGMDIGDDGDYYEDELKPSPVMSAPTLHRKKSKPMSSSQQIQAIEQVKHQLAQFSEAAGYPPPGKSPSCSFFWQMCLVDWVDC